MRLLILLLFSSSAMACDCNWYAYSALKAHGIRLITVPSVVVNTDQRYPGMYSRGVVSVKDIDDCRVRLHESCHHWQYEKLGDAKNLHEWTSRELQAAMLTMLIESEYGKCN